MRAFAKVNLFLKILARRSDGYHELASRFARVNWLYDEVFLLPEEIAVKLDGVGFCEALEVAKSQALYEGENALCGGEKTAREISATKNFAPARENSAEEKLPVTALPPPGGFAQLQANPRDFADKICSQMCLSDGLLSNFYAPQNIYQKILAHEQVRAPAGMAVAIFKRIGTRAGLGGASSDAAAVLALFERANLLRASTREIAAQIGADVAFFAADCECANVRGYGQIIEPVGFCAPKVGIEFARECQTAEIFGDFAKFGKFSEREAAERLMNANNEEIAKMPAQFCNDLLPVVLQKYPELKNFVQNGYFLSGSGGSFFKFCNDS